MADNTSVDILMMIVGQDGIMDGESLTEFTATLATDTLRKGFLPGQFSELMEFSFSAGVASSMDKNKTKAAAEQAAKAQAEKAEAEAAGKPSDGLAEMQKRLKEIKDRQKRYAKVVQGRKEGEFVDIEPVEYTRILDNSSVLLFKALSECETLPRISVVKRKATGRNASGDCYLRLDFENVLITKLDWKDTGHVMVESGEFIYRKLTVQYRPQLPSGALGKTIQSDWTMQATRTGT